MQRRSLVILLAAVPALWFYLGESSSARPVKMKTWSALQTSADVIVIVSVMSTKDLSKDDGKYIQSQESRLRVLTVLKGDDVTQYLQLRHYRYKRVDEGGPGNQVINACGYLGLKATRSELPEDPAVPLAIVTPGKGAVGLGAGVSGGTVAAGAADVRGRFDVSDVPSREGHYLMFLNREADGRMVPVTGDCDAENSVFELANAGDVSW